MYNTSELWYFHLLRYYTFSKLCQSKLKDSRISFESIFLLWNKFDIPKFHIENWTLCKSTLRNKAQRKICYNAYFIQVEPLLNRFIFPVSFCPEISYESFIRVNSSQNTEFAVIAVVVHLLMNRANRIQKFCLIILCKFNWLDPWFVIPIGSLYFAGKLKNATSYLFSLVGVHFVTINWRVFFRWKRLLLLTFALFLTTWELYWV
jgi:hypothetical protein